ncbi:hypothetical protein JCGZ_19128 [Jatropha curcas]|uniref:Uncharacterized protein n=1 Tax=Jatropha curcas TaxID=180498 RepID=A0A067K051_JATCU|nr:hypothetical protein JCGZ_19128 [Jatropha curcas]
MSNEEEKNSETEAKNVNGRIQAILKVKAMPYIPTSEKPKRIKHTAGKKRVHGRKPPLHPFSKQSKNPTETSLAQNLKNSKRLRTDSKPL